MNPAGVEQDMLGTGDQRRYRIGDVVRAFDPPYFRCIGREGRWTRLQYWLDRVRFLDFGRT